MYCRAWGTNARGSGPRARGFTGGMPAVGGQSSWENKGWGSKWAYANIFMIAAGGTPPPGPAPPLPACPPLGPAGQKVDRSVKVICPPVEGALELFFIPRCARPVADVALALHQQRPAVHARVVEGLDRVGRRPHQQDRLVPDLVLQIVPDIGDVLFAPGHLPDSRP